MKSSRVQFDKLETLNKLIIDHPNLKIVFSFSNKVCKLSLLYVLQIDRNIIPN